MKIATLNVRLLLGLLLLFASLSYFFKFGEQPKPIGGMKTVLDGFNALQYFMPLVKTIELLVGLCYVSGKFLKIANLFLLPISLNILLINIFMMPEGTPIALALFLGNIFLIYRNWDSYKGLFTA